MENGQSANFHSYFFSSVTFVGDDLETVPERIARRNSIYVIYFTMFLMSLGFSIIITGVRPYLNKVKQYEIWQPNDLSCALNVDEINLNDLMLIALFQLDPSADNEFMGYVVAANPFGQMLFSPLVGWWGNKIGSVRLPLLATLALFTASSAVYSALEIIPGDKKAYMITARFFVGVSSGTFHFFNPIFYLKFLQILFIILLFYIHRGASTPRARQPPSLSSEVVVPRIVIPPSSVLPQEGCTILRALLYSLLNMISKLYYRFHTTMR